MESVTEENVAQWISVAQLGATQWICTADAPSMGDYVNRRFIPRPRQPETGGDAIHEAGPAAGLHTYAFFIAKDTGEPRPASDSRAVLIRGGPAGRRPRSPSRKARQAYLPSRVSGTQ